MRFVYRSPCSQQALHKRNGNLGAGFILEWSILGRGVTFLRWRTTPQTHPHSALSAASPAASAPNACTHSKAQRLPLKGPSEGQRYPECWLEVRPQELRCVITFLEGLKIFRRYSDREWIVIILLSISILKTFQKVGDVPFALRVGATLLWSQS
jgi:hypothetical protein